jgi:Tfp pilus assembly protein PilV
MAWSKSQKGQSAVEVLLAVTLMAMMTLAAFVLLGTTLTEGHLADDQRVAEGLVTEGTEAVRQMRDRDFTLLVPGTYGLVKSGTDWTFSGTEDLTASLYHRSVTITQVDVDTRNVTVSVTWTPRNGRSITVDNVTRFTNWRTALPSSSACYTYTASGNWANPVTYGSVDLGPGNSGTDIVMKYPYAIMSGTASSSAKPDLFVFDVSNPSSPTLVWSKDLTNGGFNALAISGNYLYAASSDDSKELMVFDITTPSSPVTKATIDMAGTADALTVNAKGTMVVVGRAQSTATEVSFYDMTNPSTPSAVGSFDVPGDVNDFAMDTRYVYAATSSEGQDIIVYDAKNPLNPTQAATFALGDAANDLSIAYQPYTLFVGNAASQFITIDASNPLALSKLNTVSTGGVIEDIACLTNGVLFTGTNNSTKEFDAFNISNLNSISEYSSLNFPQVATGVDFANGKVYIAVRSNDALRIIGPGP